MSNLTPSPNHPSSPSTEYGPSRPPVMLTPLRFTKAAALEPVSLRRNGAYVDLDPGRAASVALDYGQESRRATPIREPPRSTPQMWKPIPPQVTNGATGHILVDDDRLRGDSSTTRPLSSHSISDGEIPPSFNRKRTHESLSDGEVDEAGSSIPPSTRRAYNMLPPSPPPIATLQDEEDEAQNHTPRFFGASRQPADAMDVVGTPATSHYPSKAQDEVSRELTLVQDDDETTLGGGSGTMQSPAGSHRDTMDQDVDMDLGPAVKSTTVKSTNSDLLADAESFLNSVVSMPENPPLRDAFLHPTQNFTLHEANWTPDSLPSTVPAEEQKRTPPADKETIMKAKSADHELWTPERMKTYFSKKYQDRVLYAKLGLRRKDILILRFPLTKEKANGAQLWATYNGQVSVSDKYYCVQLLCFRKSQVHEYVRAKADGLADAIVNGNPPKHEWPPPSGSLYIDFNDGRRDWPCWQLPTNHTPLDLTPYVISGINTLRLIQVDDLSDFIFVVYGFTPSEKERHLAAQEQSRVFNLSPRATDKLSVDVASGASSNTRGLQSLFAKVVTAQKT